MLAVTAFSPTLQAETCQPGMHPFSANYQLFNGKKKAGRAEAVLTQTGPNQWEYRFYSKVKVALLFSAEVNETTSFQFEPASGFSALNYQFSQKTGPTKKRTESRFFKTGDMHNGIGTHEGKSWNATLTGQETDRLLTNLQIAHELSAGKQKFEYQTHERGKLRQLSFLSKGEQSIETPYGQLKTHLVERDHGPDSKRQTRFWYALRLGYLPVRIERAKTGKKPISLVLESLQCGLADS